MGQKFSIKYFEVSAKENIGLSEMMEAIIEKTYARKHGGGGGGESTASGASSQQPRQ